MYICTHVISSLTFAQFLIVRPRFGFEKAPDFWYLARPLHRCPLPSNLICSRVHGIIFSPFIFPRRRGYEATRPDNEPIFSFPSSDRSYELQIMSSTFIASVPRSFPILPTHDRGRKYFSWKENSGRCYGFVDFLRSSNHGASKSSNFPHEARDKVKSQGCYTVEAWRGNACARLLHRRTMHCGLGGCATLRDVCGIWPVIYCQLVYVVRYLATSILYVPVQSSSITSNFRSFFSPVFFSPQE